MLNSSNWLIHVALAILFQSGTQGNNPSQLQMEWTLTDTGGQRHAPFEDPSTRAVVLVFISTDCPIANAYHPLLKRLAEKHDTHGVRWFMIHPDPATTHGQAAEHATQFEIEVPIVIDHDQSISRCVGARVTPEVHVFVNEREKAVYQGRIDDLHAAYGKKRSVATTHELADALNAIVDGQRIAINKTESVGCFIAFEDAAEFSKTDRTPPKEYDLNWKQLPPCLDDSGD
jgi:thiol-disulfide isomerase/thioredoxin